MLVNVGNKHREDERNLEASCDERTVRSLLALHFTQRGTKKLGVIVIWSQVHVY